MRMKIYVFTYTSTDAIGVENAEAFSTEEKARERMRKWKDAALENGDMLLYFNDDFGQILTTKGETWTAEITETVLDNKNEELTVTPNGQILIEVGGKMSSYHGTFWDGHALVRKDGCKTNKALFYPLYDDLTPEMIAEVEEYTGRPLEEYLQIAIKYGHFE